MNARPNTIHGGKVHTKKKTYRRGVQLLQKEGRINLASGQWGMRNQVPNAMGRDYNGGK